MRGVNRRRFVAASAALAAASLVRAQQPGRVYRVGMAFIASSSSTRPYEQSFLAGLRAHGFEAGRNLLVEVRHCDGDQARLPAAVQELIALKPDLLAGIEQVARVMRSRTATIPIVLMHSNDPVAAGLATSLARPGGNVTGVAALTEMAAEKQIELLSQLLPGMRTVALVLDPEVPAWPRMEEHARKVAKTKGTEIVKYFAKDRRELENVFADIAQRRPDAVVLSTGSGFFFGERRFIAESLHRLRVPAAATIEEFAELGLLFARGVDLREVFRLAASPAARVLRGANPAELPIEQATKFRLVINLKTARALGIAIPSSVLLLADSVIE